MPLLQVRDCPEDLYRKITYYAKKQNRSISQQVVVVLEKGLELDLSNIERRKKLLERINNRHIPVKVQEIDDAALIREDRNR